MNNKSERINGRLLQFYGEWKVQSGYGTFPLAKALQQKPDVSANGAWVAAEVFQGEVTSYHFQDEPL